MNKGPSASSTDQAPDDGAGQVKAEVAGQHAALVPQVAGHGAAAVPDRINGAHCVAGAGHGRRELRGRAVEAVDDDTVVQPQLQARAQHQGYHRNTLQSRDHRFFDLTQEVQVSPPHDIERRERHDRGLQGQGQPRRIVTDVRR